VFYLGASILKGLANIRVLLALWLMLICLRCDSKITRSSSPIYVGWNSLKHMLTSYFKASCYSRMHAVCDDYNSDIVSYVTLLPFPDNPILCYMYRRHQPVYLKTQPSIKLFFIFLQSNKLSRGPYCRFTFKNHYWCQNTSRKPK